jgi:hypothetical protein
VPPGEAALALADRRTDRVDDDRFPNLHEQTPLSRRRT